MKAEFHPEQAARIASLGEYGILDTEAEDVFDDIVKLASKICEMPISLISLVDSDRQWFKAEVGLGEAETDLEGSICSHAILQDDFLEIPDTTKDVRTADNPLVLGDPDLRFYAGAVLRTDEGLPLGTLCVLDRVPRALTPIQREALRVLARQVMVQLELRRAVREAEMLRHEVDHRVKNSLQSIAALTRIQRRRSKNPETVEALKLVERRIFTVAALHEELYRSVRDGRVDMAPFVQKVANLIADSAPENIRITTDLDEVEISAAQATALGVILNEFAANAFKHAFPDGRAGVVSYTARCDDDDVVFTCADNGVGFSETARAGSLGLTLMHASAQQMGAQYRLQSDASGTRATLEFCAECAEE